MAQFRHLQNFGHLKEIDDEKVEDQILQYLPQLEKWLLSAFPSERNGAKDAILTPMLPLEPQLTPILKLLYDGV